MAREISDTGDDDVLASTWSDPVQIKVYKPENILPIAMAKAGIAVESVIVFNDRVDYAKTGDEVACSVQDVTIGRQIFEEEVYYTFPPSHEAKLILKKFMHKLSSEEQEVFNEIVRIQREKEPIYGY